MTTYIVTRHHGAAEWVKARAGQAEVIPHISDDFVSQLRAGDAVIGVLPLNLAARICEAGATVYAIDLPHLRPEQRGKELTPDEMDAAGASLTEYRVEQRVALPERKVVVGSRGAFVLSAEGQGAFRAAGGDAPADDDSWAWSQVRRDDPALVAAVESLGDEAALVPWTKPEVVTIPAGTRYRVRIENTYDGGMLDVLELERDATFY